MSTLRRQPVSRPKVAVGALVALLILAAVVLLGEWLRPGGTGGGSAITADLDADPRVTVDCPAPLAREGLRTRAIGSTTPQDVASAQLYDCPGTWDRRAVRFTGEVVGGILQRGDVSWLQLNDDAYATEFGPLPIHRHYRGGNGGVGVLVPTWLIGRLEHVGGPGRRGDVVEVTGVFHRVDAATREVAIIRARDVRVLSTGTPVTQAVETRRVVVAAVLGAAALALLALQFRLRRRG